jgi:hypothetical protein
MWWRESGEKVRNFSQLNKALGAYTPLDGLPHLVDIMLTLSQVGSGCPGIPPDSEEGKEAAS